MFSKQSAIVGDRSIRRSLARSTGAAGMQRTPNLPYLLWAKIFVPRAFSLIELMVVIVIIGLLAGTVSVGVRSYMIRSKQNIAKTEIAKICQALESFYLEYDRYPTNDEGIEILAEQTDRFPEPLLDRLPNDPWKNPYTYLETGASPPYEVASYGADGREGGQGADRDILSGELEDR